MPLAGRPDRVPHHLTNVMSEISTTESPLNEPHEPHWISREAFQLLAIIFAISQTCLGFAIYHANYWVVVPLVLLGSHLMHGLLIGLHEASHGLLRKSRLLNEIDGMIIGVLSLTSFSLYRAAHQSHHAHFATVRDEEFWPFVDPSTARWKRVLYAFLELTVGMVFTPFVFIRTFFRSGSPIRNKKLRKRIWKEFILIAMAWAVILTAVTFFHVWNYFLLMHLIPAFIAGNLQSMRKYIEHVGLTGESINSATRSIVADNWGGRLVSFTLLHEPLHGIHHRRMSLPHSELPQFIGDLTPSHPDDRPPFPNYTHAFIHLFHCLADPRVGAQWHGRERPSHQDPSAAG